MNQRQIMLIILSLLVVTTVSLAILTHIILNKKFPYSCDIGKPETAGDYKQHGWYQMTQPCAVEDCVAYNKIHNSTECVV